MKDFAGTPGTITGLTLRIAQLLFAAASIASMATTSSFFNFTAFCYLIASMGLQVIWSSGLALLDAYALIRRQVLHNQIMVSLFVIGDWVTATLSLAAASASGGITVLYFHDLGQCTIGAECQKYQLSVAFAFLSWFTVFVSSLIMFWLLAAGSMYRRFKPHILMTVAQMGYTFLYFITEASFKHGMNPHVYITYRHVVGGLVMFPFAYFLERKVRPKLTVALFAEIFVLSLLGVGLTLNMYFASLRYTSPTFVTAMVNSIASLTFVIAVLLRLEVLDIRDPRGIAKVLGTLISLGGVMLMTFYRGSVLRNVFHPLLDIRQNAVVHENWLKGSVLTIASCISWPLFYILQALTLKRYPAQLSLTTWISAVGAAQSAVFTAFAVRTPGVWAVGINIDLWSTIYGGVVCSGIIIFIQLWCTEAKGPVFVTMFNPLSTILVAIIAYFILAEKLYVGSIIGATVVIIGMYLFLWGKEENTPQTNSAELYVDCEESKVPTHKAFATSDDVKKQAVEP